MQFSEILDLFFKGLQEQILTAVREELSAAATQNREKELLNAKEICEFLGIHISTLNTWKAAGKIPFKRLGKRNFFNRKEILDALEESHYTKLKKLR